MQNLYVTIPKGEALPPPELIEAAPVPEPAVAFGRLVYNRIECKYNDRQLWIRQVDGSYAVGFLQRGRYGGETVWEIWDRLSLREARIVARALFASGLGQECVLRHSDDPPNIPVEARLLAMRWLAKSLPLHRVVIAHTNGDWMPILAWMDRSLAFHPQVGWKTGWNVTHPASGCALLGVQTLAAARRAATALERAIPDMCDWAWRDVDRLRSERPDLHQRISALVNAQREVSNA